MNAAAEPGTRADAPDAKLVTFAIPCYNSAAYMDACIQSILDACAPCTDFEIVIVDDGSQKDDTAAKADDWARRLPGTVRAVHQENGGHGAAVLAGLEHAPGRYFKVVDSDDWVDRDAVQALLADIRRLEGAGETVDLFITNYVYEHVEDCDEQCRGLCARAARGQGVHLGRDRPLPDGPKPPHALAALPDRSPTFGGGAAAAPHVLR